MCCLTFCLQRKSQCTPCDLECMTEFSRRQTTGCVELFSLACYILITRVYECILPCMYCITMYVTQNAVCNCEIKSILTYLLTITQVCISALLLSDCFSKRNEYTIVSVCCVNSKEGTTKCCTHALSFRHSFLKSFIHNI